jgi:peptide/nickel transport system substrate-binding protein
MAFGGKRERAAMILQEGFDYPLSRLDPFGDHIDPPSVAIYETVVVKGPDGEAHPALADRWAISEDKLTWRFHIRPELRFHSGDRCDAPAIVAALDRLRWGFHGGKQLWYWDPVDQLYAEDAETLVMTLHYPYVRLPSLLWGTHTAIHNEARRAADPEGSGYEFADGTGPFRFVSYDPSLVVAERWGDYPPSLAAFLQPGQDPGTPVDRIEWRSMLDPKDRVLALQRGDVLCIHGPAYEDVARLEADERFRVVRFSQASNAYLALNWDRTDLEFDNVEVRRAISLGIDREALVRDAVLGYGAPTYGPISPDGEFYDPVVEQGRRYDRLAAANALDAAGWRLGDDGVRAKNGQRLAFECVIQDDAIHRRIAERLRDQLSEIGVALELQPVLSFKAFYERVLAGPSSFINKWLWQDPVDAAIGFTASWGMPRPNWQHASIPRLDDAYHAWLQAETSEALQEAATRIQLICADDLPYIPLLVPHDVWVHSTALHGWEPAQAILYPFYHRVTIESERVS